MIYIILLIFSSLVAAAISMYVIWLYVRFWIWLASLAMVYIFRRGRKNRDFIRCIKPPIPPK
jgi:hypothetical protein